MTDSTEALVWDAVYWPFGAVYSITGGAVNNLRFPGQYFLLEAGLHYNWYRHYDPTLGRYTQPDPFAMAPPDVVVPGSEGGASITTPSLNVILDPAFGLARGLDGLTRDTSNSAAVTGFPDGSSLFAYAKSSPIIRIDPKGLLTGGFSPVPPSSSGLVCTAAIDCTKVIANCQAACIGIYSDDRNSLPGVGRDWFGRMRRCVRECAARQGCGSAF